MRSTVGRGILFVGLLVPFVPLVMWAVAGEWRYPALVPSELSARALRTAASPASDIPAGLATSTLVASSVAVIAGAIGLCAGRALGLYAFRAKRLVQFLMLAPVIVPGLAVVLGIQILFIRYGLADSVPGVVIVHLIPTIPYVTLVMASVYANYDLAYEDQARVLGAGPVRVFTAVTLPAVLPGLAVAALFAFLISWSEYILTLLVGGGTVRTLPLLLFAFLGAGDASMSAALSLVIILPPLVLVALASKYLTAGRGALVGFSRL